MQQELAQMQNRKQLDELAAVYEENVPLTKTDTPSALQESAENTDAASLHSLLLQNAAGQTIMKTTHTMLSAEPNTITQYTTKRTIERNYYGADGKQTKQIANSNHGHPKQHPFGVHGEHAHDYIYDVDGNLIDRPTRELSDDERKENSDILWN